MKKQIASALLLYSFWGCTPKKVADITIISTQKGQPPFQQIAAQSQATDVPAISVKLFPDHTYQIIEGIGGAFTASTSHLLNHMGDEKQNEILKAYFSSDGAHYTMVRTHINSCDFSLESYDYTPVANDTNLVHFDMSRDEETILPLIKKAQELSGQPIKILASPWSAPPWMKDNKHWFGGSLLPDFQQTWAMYFSKYADVFAQHGLPIWAFTVENEPLGNNSNWESMHYTPEEMAVFIKEYLHPVLRKNGHEQGIFVYDQNKGEELEQWARALLADEALVAKIAGTAVHWYDGTKDWFPESLELTHQLAPEKSIIHSEACIDAEVPVWQDDHWYWEEHATDWGWDWAEPEKKHLHPKYTPMHRYAQDIIGCMNHHVTAWVDWNMVLDRQGGPNHVQNWCIAPVLVDTTAKSVYYTPLYYAMKHFSKYIRPGAKRIHWESQLPEGINLTAVKNPDERIVIQVINTGKKSQSLALEWEGKILVHEIAPEALQTIIIKQ